MNCGHHLTDKFAFHITYVHLDCTKLVHLTDHILRCAFGESAHIGLAENGHTSNGALFYIMHPQLQSGNSSRPRDCKNPVLLPERRRFLMAFLMNATKP